MVDYATWADVDPLTVEQAAYLWAGVEWTGWTPKSKEEQAAVRPRLQMLLNAVASGELPVSHTANKHSTDGDYNKSLVRRDDLTAFAIKRKQHPPFLFDTMLSDDRKAPASQPDHSPKSKGGRPAKYDWNRFYLEIIRIANLDGLPATQAKLANRMRDWFISEIDEHPADTTLEDRIRPIYQYFENPRKPPAG
jgi:hypothetical protein